MWPSSLGAQLLEQSRFCDGKAEAKAVDPEIALRRRDIGQIVALRAHCVCTACALRAHCVHTAHAEAGILTQEYLSPDWWHNEAAKPT